MLHHPVGGGVQGRAQSTYPPGGVLDYRQHIRLRTVMLPDGASAAVAAWLAGRGGVESVNYLASRTTAIWRMKVLPTAERRRKSATFVREAEGKIGVLLTSSSATVL